jgi:hypothetical protein
MTVVRVPVEVRRKQLDTALLERVVAPCATKNPAPRPRRFKFYLRSRGRHANWHGLKGNWHDE